MHHLARLWPSGSVAERIGNAFLELWAEFFRLVWMARHEKTLFLAEMSPHSGECVAEGGAAFVNQAPLMTASRGFGPSCAASRVTREDSPSRQGVRAMARSDH